MTGDSEDIEQRFSEVASTIHKQNERIAELESWASKVEDHLAELRGQAAVADRHIATLERRWAMEAELRNHDDVELSNQIGNLARQVETSRMLIDELGKVVKQLASELAKSIQTTQRYETYLANKLRAYGGKIE